MNRNGNLSQLTVLAASHKKNVEALTQLFPSKFRISRPDDCPGTLKVGHPRPAVPYARTAFPLWDKAETRHSQPEPESALNPVHRNPKRMQHLTRPKVLGDCGNGNKAASPCQRTGRYFFSYKRRVIGHVPSAKLLFRDEVTKVLSA